MEPTSAIFQHLRRVLQQTYFLNSMSLSELDKLMVCLKPMRVFKNYAPRNATVLAEMLT